MKKSISILSDKIIEDKEMIENLINSMPNKSELNRMREQFKRIKDQLDERNSFNQIIKEEPLEDIIEEKVPTVTEIDTNKIEKESIGFNNSIDSTNKINPIDSSNLNKKSKRFSFRKVLNL